MSWDIFKLSFGWYNLMVSCGCFGNFEINFRHDLDPNKNAVSE